MEHNEQNLIQYMVEFDIPQPITTELLEMIPEQTEAVDVLFTSGKMLSYTLSADRSRLWAVMLASSESELLSYIDSLPMTPYMDFDYSELMFHNTVHLMPAMSLN